MYGASPQEAVEIRKGEVLKALAAAAPRAEAFMNAEGKVDFDAYKKAVAGWREQLPILAASIGNPMLEQSQKDGVWNGEQLKAWLGKVDVGMLDDYRRRNDSAAEAAQRAWFELVYNKQFDALGKMGTAKDGYAKTVGSVGAMDTQQMIGLVKQLYGGRWTDEQLGVLLKGMTMPSMKDVIKQNTAPDKAALNDARDAFNKMRDEVLPPGRMGFEASKQIPLLAALMDGKLNDLATAEHYRLGALMLGGWAKANKIEGNPAEWAAAKEMKAGMDDTMVQQFGADGAALLKRYFAAAAGVERAQLLAANPVIGQMLPVWNKLTSDPLYQKYYASEASQKAGGSSQKSVVSSQTGAKAATGGAQTVKGVSAEFWAAYNAMDSKARGALVKGNPVLMKVVDAASRGGASVADWQQALKALGGSSQKAGGSSQKSVVSSQTGAKAGVTYAPKAATTYAPKQTTAYAPKQATSYAPKAAATYAPKAANTYAPKQATGDGQIKGQYWETYNALSAKDKALVKQGSPLIAAIVDPVTRAGMTAADYAQGLKVLAGGVPKVAAGGAAATKPVNTYVPKVAGAGAQGSGYKRDTNPVAYVGGGKGGGGGGARKTFSKVNVRKLKFKKKFGGR